MREPYGLPKILRPSRTFLGVEVYLLRRHYRFSHFGEQRFRDYGITTAMDRARFVMNCVDGKDTGKSYPIG